MRYKGNTSRVDKPTREEITAAIFVLQQNTNKMAPSLRPRIVQVVAWLKQSRNDNEFISKKEH